jgi:hypothetical protein
MISKLIFGQERALKNRNALVLSTSTQQAKPINFKSKLKTHNFSTNIFGVLNPNAFRQHLMGERDFYEGVFMKKFIVNLTAAIGFLACLSMQAYLLVLLTSTTLLAQTEPAVKEVTVNETVKVEAADSKAPAKTGIAEKKTTNKGIAAKIKEGEGEKNDDLNIRLNIGKNGFNIFMDDEEDGKDKKAKSDKIKSGINIQGDDVDIESLLRQVKEIEKVKHPRGVLNDLEDIIVPLAAFAMIFGLVYMVFVFRARARREKIETIKMFVDKGQPIPEALFDEGDEITWVAQMQKGIKLCALGVGVGVFLAAVDGPWAVGLMLLCIGLGHVASAKFRQSIKNK